MKPHPRVIIRQVFIILAVFFLLMPGVCFSQGTRTSHENIRLINRDSEDTPNVVLIMLGDLGFCDLACYGNKFVQTPNISWLHGNSIRMENYHSSTISAQTCAAVLTGRYPERMGVWRDAAGRNVLRFGEFTLAELLKQGGYRTAVFGKWNLGMGDFYAPEYRGFDESLIIPADGLGQIPDFWGNADESPVMRHNGKPVQTRGNITRTIFDSASKFSQVKSDSPFFIFMPMTVCSPPCRPTEKYLDEIIASGVEEETAKYYALLRDFDDALGDFIKKFQKNGLLKNTIIIFTSGNGSPHATFNKNFSGGKGSLREGGHRVPFFIFWQREFQHHKGSDIQRLVMHMDVAPTILDICGLKTDRKLTARFDGISFRPLLLSGGEAWFPRTLYMQPRNVETFQTPVGSLVMNERFRFLDGRQLYDVQDDLRQLKDVSGPFASDMKTLEKLYKKWFQDVVVEQGMPVNPIYVGGGLTFSEKIGMKKSVQAETFKTETVPDAKTKREIMQRALTVIRAERKTGEPDVKTPPPVTVLTCYDWRMNAPLVYPGQLAALPAESGVWETEFLEAGTYEFTLRIAPENVPRPIPAVTAFLQLDKKSTPATVPRDATEVKILAEVPAGPVTIRALFKSSSGTFGAYFVYVRKVK